MAGNETEKTITFSANRFGSVYNLSEVEDIISKYLKVEEDIVFTETNVDSLDRDGIKIKLTKNGTPSDLVEGTDYTVEVTGGNGQWSVYKYTVNKKLFADDGRYSISIYSKDAAGNVNENIDETKEAEISFGIDKTKPVVVPIDFESGKQYPVEMKTVSVEIKDNLVLESVKIYLNGKEICFKCKQKIDEGTIVCPYCGEYLNISDKPHKLPIKKKKFGSLGTFWRIAGIILMVIGFFVNTVDKLSLGRLGIWFSGALLYAFGRYLKYKNYDLAAKDKLSRSIKNKLAEENNESVKLIAKSVVIKRMILSLCFAGIIFVILNFLYYTYWVIVLLPITLLIYQSIFYRFNTIKTIYKKIKKNPDNTLSDIIIQETYNETEEPQIAKSILICFAAFAIAVGGFIYLNLNSNFVIEDVEGGATLVRYEPGLIDLKKDVAIPEKIDNKKIISIYDDAFSYNVYIPSVVMPETIMEIGKASFYDCRSLSKITLSSNMTKLPESSFKNCYSLENIEIPSGVTELGKSVFEDCHKLRSITIPEGVTVIPEKSFDGCSVLDEINWHDGITEIHDYAFANCDKIIYAGFPLGVTEISNHLFEGCSNLETVYINRGITKIGEYAFNNCKSLNNVYIPDTVTEIGDSAFYDCDALEKVYLPKNIKVHTDAFDREVTQVKDKPYTDETSDKIDQEFEELEIEKFYIIYDKNKGEDVVFSPENNNSVTVSHTDRISEKLADNMDLFVVETPTEFVKYLKSARDAKITNVLLAFDSQIAAEVNGKPTFVSYNYNIEELIEFYEENPNEF